MATLFCSYMDLFAFPGWGSASSTTLGSIHPCIGAWPLPAGRTTFSSPSSVRLQPSAAGKDNSRRLLYLVPKFRNRGNEPLVSVRMPEQGQSWPVVKCRQVTASFHCSEVEVRLTRLDGSQPNDRRDEYAFSIRLGRKFSQAGTRRWGTILQAR